MGLDHGELFDALINTTSSGVLCLDDTGAVIATNQLWSQLTGFDASGGVEALLTAVTDPDALGAALQLARTEHVDIAVEFWPGVSNAHYATLHLRPVSTGLLVVLDDTSAQQSAQARYDALTGVLSRPTIEEHVGQVLESDGLSDRRIAAVVVDLDAFEPINAKWGHAMGDAVLTSVAERIGELVRPGDAVGRLGSDEFLALLVDLPTNDDVTAVAARIEAELPALGVRFKEPVDISASVGWTWARAGDTFDSLVRRSSSALAARRDTQAQ